MDVVRPDLKVRRRRRHLIILAATAAAITTIAITAVALGSAKPMLSRSEILTDTVRQGELLRAVRGPGKLVPSQMRWVIARTDARVERLLVRPGELVSADTVILELSNPEVEDDLQAAYAAYAAAKADHDAALARSRADVLALQASLAAIEGEHETLKVQERAERLGLDSGVIPAVQHARTTIALDQLQRRVLIERQRVAQSRAFLRAQTSASGVRLEQLRRTSELRQIEAEGLEIRAGQDGVLQSMSVEEGQRVEAGANLARVARPGSLIAELRIAQAQAADLAIGQLARIDTGYGVVVGNVRHVNPEVDNGSILVEVALPQAMPSGVRTDQSVDGTVEIGRLRQTLYVVRPINALADSDTTVFKLIDDGSARRVPVTLGKDSINQIQVVRGLRAGDRILVSDTSAYEQYSELGIE